MPARPCGTRNAVSRRGPAAPSVFAMTANDGRFFRERDQMLAAVQHEFAVFP